MRILHIGLPNGFTEGMQYQDNFLTDYNIMAGHNVIYVTCTKKFEKGEIVDTEEEDITLDNGLRLIRYKYDSLLFSLLTEKIQKVRKLRGVLQDFQPDSIMYHGVCGYELLDVANYVKRNPETLFYVDSHENFGNTARTRLSKFAYKYIHGGFVKKALPYVKKILYLDEDCRLYLKEMYNIPDDKLEFYPLGGIIQSKDAQEEARKHLLKRYNLPEDAIIFMHSGKMVKEKKTANLLRAFRNLSEKNIYMFIFGSVPDECKEEIMGLIDSDERVFYLGWKSGDEITELLNAADVYCQPGTPSVTSQVALCCGCAEIVYPIISYKLMYEDSVLFAETDNEILLQLQKMTNQSILNKYKEKGYQKACKILDYKKIAERYLK